MDLMRLVSIGTEKNASDIHITVGIPPVLRINGKLVYLNDNILKANETKKLVYDSLNKILLKELEKKGEVDTSFSNEIGRCRVNVFKERGNYSMALRIIPLKIPTMEDLALPSTVKEFTRLPRGLILVTGPTGSGKSTTLASMINQINRERSCHVLTLEDPIEYLHKHNKSIVNQREIGTDSISFSNSLRAALRQDPDVILVGEMRDLETISTVLTAAETGHLVLSTLHTIGSAKTIDRIIDVFPPHQQQQIRIQLSSVIQGVISQQLLPRKDNTGRIAAFEIMKSTPAIKNLIREGKIHQIDTAIQTGAKHHMQTMDSYLLKLYKSGLISKETTLNQSINREYIKNYII